MFDRFTERARRVMGLARQEAQRFNHEYIGTEHILLGLIQEGSGVAANVLKNLDIDLDKIRREVEKIVQTGPSMVTMGQLPFTPRAKKVLELAVEEASNLGHNYIGTEHLLLGLIRENEGVAAQVLLNLDLKLDDVREEVLELLGADMPSESGSTSETKRSGGKSKTPALDAFGRDLTELAREGKLDPVIGRANEIERVMQILSRRTKNNPVLLGEPGVGKTAIVEGLAQSVIQGEVPEILMDRRIVVLDLAMMVAGTKYRGQFEERIKAVMAEVRRDTKVILFIDELHTLVGAGGAEGAIDASNVLKPALSRGEVQCIGATTLDEYRKYIEKDGALERRFQTILVNPPSKEETVEILLGLRDKYEAHHRVSYTDQALEGAVELSTRYITGRFLPDKAIDVIDEAGARLRMKSMTRPPDLKKIELEIKACAKEKEEAVSAQDFERAASIRDKAGKLEEKQDKIRKEWRDKANESGGTVDLDMICETVSKMTGVPLTRLEKGEAERLLQMEAELHKTVVSQDSAVKAVARALRRSRSGLKDPRRPMGSFIFLGPTGVGKTLLAKTLAKFMFGDADALVTIDMSEYMEKHNVSRLVGAPPGYVGFEEGGQLTEKVRRRPYAVVLFDEIEKAHGDVFNMLLQIMEEGKLTDSFGRVVDFKNTIVIMTSNLGTQLAKNQTSLGFTAGGQEADYETMVGKMKEELEREFRPEFLNRVDDVIIFRQLRREDLSLIIDIELAKVLERLKSKGLDMVLNDEARELLIDKGFNPDYGARPLRRALEHDIEDPLAEELLRGTFEDKNMIRVTVEEGKLAFEADMVEESEDAEAEAEPAAASA
ncbi:MAG: ATP-dependent Clp protease ATP-binding subunit [Planctomycetota bacterium]|jgi:ATP-dependent Clp protease ATP-binding subunit ClpC